MMVTKAIVGPHSASKNTNKSRGTRIFMRENTQAEQWEAKSSRHCEPHLKCETFIFLQVTAGAAGGGKGSAGTRGPQRPFVEEIQLASPTIGPVPGQLRVARLGGRGETFA